MVPSRVWRLVFLSGCCLPLLWTVVQARVLDAHDLAVGDWDVKLRCGTDFYSTLLFPSSSSSSSYNSNKGSSSSSSSGYFDKTKKMLSNKFPTLPPLPFQTKAFPCQLSIFPNGTFALRPKEKKDKNYNLPSLGSALTADSESEGRQLLLRGRWKVEANPYCITDRFYDELHLESYPRKLVHQKRQSTRKQITSRASVSTRTDAAGSSSSSTPSSPSFLKRIIGSRNNNDDNEEEVLHRLSLQLHCRMCGRYASPGPWRTIRGQKEKKARLTRGMLVWKSANQKRPTARQPYYCPVGASFRGQRIVPRHSSSHYEDQEQLDIFGY